MKAETSQVEAIPIKIELFEDDPTSLLADRVNEELSRGEYVDIFEVPKLTRTGPDTIRVATCGVVLLVVKNKLLLPETQLDEGPR